MGAGIVEGDRCEDRHSSLARNMADAGDQARDHDPVKAAQVKALVDKSAAIAEEIQRWMIIGCPSADAKKQPDGSFILELDDKSTLRWTSRPNGTWRKPEHKKAGFVGELEQEKYTMPLQRASG